MFTTVTKKANIPYRQSCVGYTVDNNEYYIDTLVGSLYIRTELRYKIFGEISPIRHYLNVVPTNRTPKNTSFNFEIYKGTVMSPDDVIVFSTVPFNVCAGQYLDTQTTHAIVNFANTSVVTEHSSHVVGVLNADLPVHYENPSANDAFFVYVHGGMTTCAFNLNKECLLHPLSMRKNNSLAMYFKTNKIVPFPYKWNPPAPLGLSDTIELKQPFLLFSAEDQSTWYKYNFETTQFVAVVPAGSYVSMSELETHGNTFEEYEQIPESAFDTQFGIDTQALSVLTNGYMFPRTVKHAYWLQHLDTQDYIWVTTQNSKHTIMSGLL